MGGTFAYYVIYNCLYYCGLTPVSRGNATAHVGHMVFGGGVFVVTFMFQFLNPFFEELLARAYVMTEIKFLTNNLPLAVIASTALQTSYHFYQGVPSAMGIGANFLLWSIFYAKTGRIVPLILAHMYEDVLATMSYATHAFLPV
jgi:membrane protease YdiL (CAAX protease family)